MNPKSLVPLRPSSRLARLAPWLLLWGAAPMPLWLALGMMWYFRH